MTLRTQKGCIHLEKVQDEPKTYCAKKKKTEKKREEDSRNGKTQEQASQTLQ